MSMKNAETGRTNTNAGLELAETMLEEYEREDSQDVIILMTDGNATAELNADLDDTVWPWWHGLTLMRRFDLDDTDWNIEQTSAAESLYNWSV